jgi:hypothetical protein
LFAARLFISIDRARWQLHHFFAQSFRELSRLFACRRCGDDSQQQPRLYIDFMQAQRVIVGLSFFFNHLSQPGPACFLHAGLIHSNNAFVTPARRCAFAPPRLPRPALQRAHYIMARRHSKEGAAVRLRQSKP